MVYSIAKIMQTISLKANNECANKLPNCLTKFLELVQKFRCQANKKREMENLVVAMVVILGHVARDSTLNTRKLARASGIKGSSFQTILKKHKLHPYKIHLVQQ